MRKYGVLRIKITLLITMLLLLVSIITSAVLINNANKGFNQIYLSEAEPPAENYEDIYTSTTADEDITGEYGIAKPAPAIMSATLINTSSNFSKTTIIYMFSITLVASVSTWIIMGYSLKKINVLNKEIKTIGENNFTIDIEKFAGNDEVSELATSFQNMLSKLEKAFLVQKNFVSGAAHELKTPLTIMKSSLQVLNLDDTTTISEYKENAQLMEESTNRLINLVNDLMKLATNSDIEKNHRVSIENIINQSLKDLKEQIKEKNINVSTYVEEVVLKGNHNLLYRALFNIIENAIKYNVNNGQLIISLSQNSTYAVVKIKDTGIGIKEEDVSRVFDTFYRGEKSRSREYGGAGLGLSISKSIIDFHNGEINLNSNENYTEFIVKIPLF